MEQQPMKFLGAIAAMTKDHVIGLNGALPWHYSVDLRRFKKTTMDSTIIMGRLTWESMGCRPLPGRRNIVISRAVVAGVEHYSSIEDALSACQSEHTWIIGGGQIYAAAFSYLTLLDITYVPDVISDPGAVIFPEITSDIWEADQPTHVEDSDLINIIYKRRT